MIEVYRQAPVVCVEYDPLAPRVARLVSDLIFSRSADLCNSAARTRGADPGEERPSEATSLPGEIAGTNRFVLVVEHIGSTAVPGCAGKGVINLMLLYDEGGLDHAKRVLDSLGFQRQVTRDPFPESRPMRLRAVNCHGKQYRLHVHVISAASPEAATLCGFRDALVSR